LTIVKQKERKMKTHYTFKLAIASLFIAGALVSCNQTAKNNRTTDTTVDSMEVMRINKARMDETRTRARYEMDRIRMRWDSLDSKDPDFNTKLDRELDRFNSDLDSLDYRLARDGYEMDDEMDRRYDSLRIKSNELKAKLKRWADKTGENLDELGEDIKRNFEEFKESLRDDDN
jgi:hypothetical protein